MPTPSLVLVRSRRTRPAIAALAVAAALGLGVMAPVAPAHAQFAGTQQVPASFADIVDRVKGAVVSIHVVAGGEGVVKAPSGQRGRKMPEFKGIPGLPEDHPLNEFFKNLPREFGGGGEGGGGGTMPMLAQGSGFVISEDGYVVTNNHVIENASKIQLSFDNQKPMVDAELVGTDQRTDVALLKIKSPTGKLPYVKLADKEPRVGDWVIAVGNPFGFGGTVTAGIVSALARDVGSGPYDYLQIDAAVNRGNSGGPTFNLAGDVIGVNTAIYSPSGGSVGIAFAIPSRTVIEVVNQLKSSGTVSRGWLGVKIQNIDDDTAASLGLGDARGALVNEVTPGGPAALAGLQNGDAILSVNGDKIADSRDLARKVAGLSPNTTADVAVLRSGKEQKVAVKLGDFKDASGPTATPARTEPSKPAAPADLGQLGLKLSAARGNSRDGVAIVEVDADSDAALKGLRPGDVILEVSNQPVASVDDVSKGVSEASKLGRKAVLLRVRSGDQTRFIAVQIKKG